MSDIPIVMYGGPPPVSPAEPFEVPLLPSLPSRPGRPPTQDEIERILEQIGGTRPLVLDPGPDPLVLVNEDTIAKMVDKAMRDPKVIANALMRLSPDRDHVRVLLDKLESIAFDPADTEKVEP